LKIYKKCIKCGKKKLLSEIYKDKFKVDGYRPDCKECSKIRHHNYYMINKKFLSALSKKYYQEHKEEYTKTMKKYYKNNKKKIITQQKKYYDENKEKIKSQNKKRKNLKNIYMKNYIKKRAKIDIRFKLLGNLRHSVYLGIKKHYKSLSTMFLIGCSIDYLMYHLQEQFTKGMSWDNYGDWHIDHIKPCARFDLSKPEEQRKCFHYTNLQPLWAEENLRKGDKYVR